MTTHDIARAERVEMYLKAVYIALQAATPATVSKVAEAMGVSAPSASEMLRRLEQQGYVVTGGDEGYRLTASGRSRATQVVRRLRLAERLLHDILKLDLPKVHDEACKMEHVISDEVEARLADILGHPRICPHGLPIPGEVDDAVAGVPLVRLSPGIPARVVVVPEEDAELLVYLTRLGMVPGAHVTVEDIAPFNGPITVSIDGNHQAIGPDVAARIHIVT